MPAHRTVRALSLLALLLLALSTGVSRLRTNDLFIHLVTGGIVLDELRIPTTDRYSFTAPGARYVTHEWLAATWYALGERAAGTLGVIFASKLIPSLAILAGLLAALRTRRVHPAIGVGVATAALAVARNRLTQDRPELLAIAALMALLWLLLRDQRLAREGQGDRAVYWAVPLTIFWANVHASFPLGIALVAAFAIAGWLDWWFRPDAPRRGGVAIGLLAATGAVAVGVSQLPPASFARPAALVLLAAGALFALDARVPVFERRPEAPTPRPPVRLLPVLLAMLAAIALNPQGVAIYWFPFEFTAAVNPVTERIGEWRPLFEASFLAGSFEFSSYLAYLAVWATALALATARGALSRSDLGVLLLFGLLPLRHIRWMGMFALVTAPALAATLDRARQPARTKDRHAAGRRAAALPFVALALAAGWGVVQLALPGPWDARYDAAIALAALSGGVAVVVAASRTRRTEASTALATGLCALLAALAILQGVPGQRGNEHDRGLQWRRLQEVGGTLAVAAPAIAFLREQRITGKLLTEYSWAGYAIHQLWPGVTVFLDSRSEVYGNELLSLLLDMKHQRALATRALTEHGVELVLVESRAHPYDDRERYNAGILDTVAEDPRWGLLYFDDRASLYGHRGTGDDNALPAFLEDVDPRRLTPRTLARPDPRTEATLRKAVERAPGASLPRFALASLLSARGQREEAMLLLEDAWRANPTQPAAPELAARIAARADDDAATRVWLERTLEAAPHWRSARARFEALPP